MRQRRDAPVVIACVAALALCIGAARGANIPGLELRVFRVIDGAPDVPFAPFWVLMQLGNVLALTAGAAFALWAGRRRLAVAVLLGGFGAYHLTKLVKHFVPRPRPSALIADVHIRGAVAMGSGFPAGHAAVAAFLATVLGPLLGRPARYALYGWVVVVGALRVYVGAHLPIDVVAGAAIGIACGVVARRVAERVTAPVIRDLRPWASLRRRSDPRGTAPGGSDDHRRERPPDDIEPPAHQRRSFRRQPTVPAGAHIQPPPR